MRRAWRVPVSLLVVGAGVAAWSVVRGEMEAAVGFLVVYVVVAGVGSALVFPRSVGAVEARRRSAVDGRAVVYWRPGRADVNPDPAWVRGLL